MSRIAELLPIAATFIWLGMVIAISLIEAPLKFRAPGITLALGLGIGRLVFRALNRAEAVLVVMTTVAFFFTRTEAVETGLLAALWLILLVQLLGLRPRLDTRAQRMIDGATQPRSRAHLLYIALEAAKVLALAGFGTALLLGGQP